jgi:GntR family transcriptional repressor for pyruvate dehydrogenase complex
MKFENKFTSFDRRVLSEQIAQSILDMIRDQKLRPGDRLPPERELAAMMQVSRPPLREALRALTIMHVIENRRRLGTFVTSLEPQAMVENISFILSLDVPTFVNVIEARKAIEPGLAANAARKISPEQLDELEACVLRSEEMVNDPQEFINCDQEIHRRIADAAQNNILSVFMNSIHQVSMYSRRKTTEIPEVPARTLQDHRRLLKAIKDHDPEKAAEVMLEHLDYVEKRLVDQDNTAHTDTQEG